MLFMYLNLKIKQMADNKNKQDSRDDSKIDSKDASEITYAAKQFNVTPEQVKQAIAKVGNSRARVKEYLSGKWIPFIQVV